MPAVDQKLMDRVKYSCWRSISRKMFSINLFSLFYDLVAYLAAFRSLIDEILYKLHLKRHIDVKNDLPIDLSGQVAVVTGGTRGLGLTVVRALISKGCYVIVATSQTHARFAKLVEKFYDGLAEQDPDTGVKRGSVELQYLDLSSLASVKKFIQSVKSTKLDVNYLICNAGIMFAPRQLTEDNLELHLAVNYIGHSLIIWELLPELRSAANKSKMNSRIISVSSSTHIITRLRFDDLLGEIDYSSSQAYAQSKLAQIMFTSKLARYIKETKRWSNVQCFSLHPGVVLSELYEHVHLIKYFPFLVPIIRLVTRDMVQGAETTLYATLSSELDDRSGDYLEDSAIKESSKVSRNLDSQDRLWDLTKSILRDWTTTDMDDAKSR